MTDLIRAIQKQFNSVRTDAVFFHLNEDGELKTLSPLVSTTEPRIMIKRLRDFAAACLITANDMEKKLDTKK